MERDTSIIKRQGIAFKFVQLLRENMDRIASVIVLEQGKTLLMLKVMFYVGYKLLKLLVMLLMI